MEAVVKKKTNARHKSSTNGRMSSTPGPFKSDQFLGLANLSQSSPY